MQTKRWRLSEAVATRGGDVIPAGTEVEIIRKFNGFNVRSKPCPHCGVQSAIRGLHWGNLEQITE